MTIWTTYTVDELADFTADEWAKLRSDHSVDATHYLMREPAKPKPALARAPELHEFIERCKALLDEKWLERVRVPTMADVLTAMSLSKEQAARPWVEAPFGHGVQTSDLAGIEAEHRERKLLAAIVETPPPAEKPDAPRAAPRGILADASGDFRLGRLQRAE